MKNIMIVSLTLVFTSCVSVQEYSALEKEFNAIKEANKKINKEIRLVEKANRALEVTITKAIVRNSMQSVKIEKRLATKKIKVKLDPKKMVGISIKNQAISEDYYSTLLKDKNFKDTNSAKKTEWMSAKEKELVYWLNYARLNPQKFCMKYIYPQYVRDSNNVYLATLMDYMLNMKPVPALFPEKALFESAKCHAETMGKKGEIGHNRIDGCKGVFSGECCSYGLSDPLAIVIQLLVDEGVTSLGHRYICLGTYSKVGISIQPHKSYGTNCVLDFGYHSI